MEEREAEKQRKKRNCEKQREAKEEAKTEQSKYKCCDALLQEGEQVT